MNKIVIVFLFSISQLLAQDISTNEVRVVEGFKPSISDASRLNEKAAFSDTIKKDRKQEYAIVDTDLKSDYQTRPLKAAKIKADKIVQLYGTKLGLGFGNMWATKLSVVHNSKRAKNLSYGVLMNHSANKYDVSNMMYKNSKNTMYLYAKKMSASHIFITNFDYDRRTALFWSKNPVLTDEKYYRNRFAYTKFTFSAISKVLSVDKLKHHTTFFVSDLNEFSENQINISSNLSKTINSLPFFLEMKFNDYLRYYNVDARFENTDFKSFSFSPSIVISKYGIDFDLAVDFDFMSDDSPVGFFPQFKATKELVKDILLVSGGLIHNKQRHTIKSLSDENPYIHSFGVNQSILGDNSFSQHLKVTDIQELYLTIRNVLALDEVLKVSFAYGIVKNFAHFIGLTNNNYNRFQVDYLDVRQLHANANYYREINSIINLNMNMDYYKWDKEVYHKPNFTFDVSTPINLRNKVKVAPSLNYIGKRKTISFFDSELDLITPLFKNLASQLHINLGVYYRYTKNISSYINLNNLTNSKQDSWNGYREVGLSVLFGFNYSF